MLRVQCRSNSIAALVRLDGRQKDSLREQLQKAARAEAAASDADADADAAASTAAKWFPQSSSPATKKR